MVLLGPPRRPTSAAATLRTGGAGNNTWYDTNNRIVKNTGKISARQQSARGQSSAHAVQSAAAVATQRAAAAISAQPLRFDASLSPQASSLQPTLVAPLSSSSGGHLSGTNASLAAASSRSVRAQSARGSRDDANYAHDSKCICDICVCGRHACPPTPRVTHYDPNMTSEARSAYNGVFQPAKRVGAPDAGRNANRQNVPFEGQSAYKGDYVPHPLAKRSAPCYSEPAPRNTAPFDPTTTHKSDYPAHKLDPRGSQQPRKDNLATSGEPDDRDFTTEARATLKPYAFEPRKPRRAEPAPPSLPFTGGSMYRNDYPQHPLQRTGPLFRAPPVDAAPDDRDWQTENRGNFTPKRVEQCPAIPPYQGGAKHHAGHILVEKKEGWETWRRKPGY